MNFNILCLLYKNTLYNKIIPMKSNQNPLLQGNWVPSAQYLLVSLKPSEYLTLVFIEDKYYKKVLLGKKHKEGLRLSAREISIELHLSLRVVIRAVDYLKARALLWAPKKGYIRPHRKNLIRFMNVSWVSHLVEIEVSKTERFDDHFVNVDTFLTRLRKGLIEEGLTPNLIEGFEEQALESLQVQNIEIYNS